MSIEIEGSQRWSIYQRLRELSVECECSLYQPLQVAVENPIGLILTWSVIKNSTAPRLELIKWLEHCWNLS